MSVFPEFTGQKYAAIIAALNARFENRAAIRPGEALTALPRTHAKDGEASARQMLKRGSYPFPTFFMGGLRCVLVADIAETLCNATEVFVRPAPRVPGEGVARGRRRGRPRKIAQCAVTKEVSNV